MNRQVNPDHCYETEEGVLYMLTPVPGSPEWDVMKNGVKHRSFTSLRAAQGYLEHVLGVADIDRNFGLNERYEDSASYRADMIDAGRGRLLR
jgi:hypothetical protein